RPRVASSYASAFPDSAEIVGTALAKGRDVQDRALVSIKTVWRISPRLIGSHPHGDTHVDAQDWTHPGHPGRSVDGDGMRWQRVRHDRTALRRQNGSRHALPDVHTEHPRRERRR